VTVAEGPNVDVIVTDEKNPEAFEAGDR